MTELQKEKSANDPGDKLSTVYRKKAVWLSAAMLAIGLVVGALFGIMKTTPLPGGQPNGSMAASDKLQALEAEASQNPQNAEVWIRLGNAYFDADQYQKSIEAYEKSLDIEAENPNVLTDLGVMYRLSKQPQKAVEVFSRAMSIDPLHEMSRMNKGVVLMYDLKDEKSAIEAWGNLLEINPLATFSNGQSVDSIVWNYNKSREKERGRGK